MTRVMYFDCFSGAAGDMTLGALLDAGLPLDALRNALGSLGVGHELKVTKVLRAGISATRVEVEVADGAAGFSPPRHSHPHSHDHADPHRSLNEIAHLIDHSNLSTAGKARAVAMFRRLAEVEAAIHQMSVDDVHLHEVGAVDSIIDIVGVVFGMEWFGIDDVVVSPLNVGSGTVQIAHGRFPVPAPATLALLHGVPMYSLGPAVELTTPTGALVMSTYAKAFGPAPAMTVEAVGYGAGTRDFPGAPNVLRVLMGTRLEGMAVGASPRLTARWVGQEDLDVVEIACEIDDMNPQWFSPTMDRLLSAGALDVYLTAIVMKKGRPGTLVTVLAPEAAREALCEILFRETTTIGLRWHVVERETLHRQWVEVPVTGGQVRIKVADRAGEVLNAAPEFEDCQRVAHATGRALKVVHAEAVEAWTRHVRESSR